MERIYLDHVTTAPPSAAAMRSMLPYLGARFANASSPTDRGAEARAMIEEAREAVAYLASAPPEEIIFTGSATESNNLAIKGIIRGRGAPRGHLIAAATEHTSILHPLRTLERSGYRMTLLPVDGDGRIDPEKLAGALTGETLLVTIAHASSEIGTLQPIAEICRVAHARGVPVHCDRAVTTGILPIPSGEDRPDLVTLSPNPIGGPQGIAALQIRKGIRLSPLIEGGVQEGGLRAGTEAVALVAGFGAAAREAAGGMEAHIEQWTAHASRLRALLADRLEGTTFTGHPNIRIPGHLSLCLRGIEAESLLRALDDRGLEATSGSPCTTEVFKTSHVLEAIGIDPILARGALVLSFGVLSRPEDPERAAGLLPEVVSRLRALSPLTSD
ncbi:MAG: cysteine desulfurase family protein [Acidobacteriota bacterium]